MPDERYAWFTENVAWQLDGCKLSPTACERAECLSSRSCTARLRLVGAAFRQEHGRRRARYPRASSAECNLSLHDLQCACIIIIMSRFPALRTVSYKLRHRSCSSVNQLDARQPACRTLLPDRCSRGVFQNRRASQGLRGKSWQQLPPVRLLALPRLAPWPLLIARHARVPSPARSVDRGAEFQPRGMRRPSRPLPEFVSSVSDVHNDCMYACVYRSTYAYVHNCTICPTMGIAGE